MQISIFQKRKLDSCRTDSCPNHKKKGVELAAVHPESGPVYFLCRSCWALLRSILADFDGVLGRQAQQERRRVKLEERFKQLTNR